MIAAPVKLRLRYDRGTLRAYTRFSGPLFVAGASGFVMAWTAVIAAKLDLGIAAVGVIALAATITGFTDRVDQLVTGALYPAVCAVRDQRSLLYESLVKSNRLALMWAVPFGVGITLFSTDLVRFGIGERWHAAIPVLQVYGLAAAINHVGFNWTAYFRARDDTRPIAVATAAATLVFVTTGVPLMLAWGLRGFALGIVLQGLAAVALRAFYLRRLFPAFDFLRHAARAFLPTAPAAAVVLLWRLADPGASTLAVALGELLSYAAVTVLATWYLESGLLREVAAMLRDRRPAPAAS
jgi:O-antigen/teichoic acid export membrane protein